MGFWLFGLSALMCIGFIASYAKAASPGKHLLKLRVYHAETGRPLNFWQMLLRECIGKLASQMVLYYMGKEKDDLRPVPGVYRIRGVAEWSDGRRFMTSDLRVAVT